MNQNCLSSKFRRPIEDEYFRYFSFMDFLLWVIWSSVVLIDTYFSCFKKYKWNYTFSNNNKISLTFFATMDPQNENNQEHQIPQENVAENMPVPSEEDIQAFIIAIKSGSVDQMKEFIDKFQSNICNRLESQLRQPPLYFAAILSDENVCHQMVKTLVEAGANPNFKDANEQTIMFYLCRDGKKQTAEYILEKGCRLDEQDLYGQTPVFYVVSENRLQMLDLIPDQLLNHVDKLAKQTPLYYSARKGHFNMCKALVQRGCDPSHLDTHKKTPIEYARKARFQEVADFLSQEAKRSKDINKSGQNNMDSEMNESTKKKKKDIVTLNHTKNAYKITVMKENGEIHDLTQQEVKELMKMNQQLESYLTNPDSIPQQLLESTVQESWQKVASKILSNCWKIKGAYWFHEPVDTVKYGITDYNDIIAKPMDLGTVKRKLNHNAYPGAKEFIEQMRLIWKNCYRYNGNQHEISKFAREVEVLFEESVASMGLTKYVDE